MFSHESKLALIQEAQAQGFLVMLLVVCMDHPEKLLVRVRQRVGEGGHNVPAERILARYPRSLANLRLAVRLADAALLHDSGTVQPGTHRLIATCEGVRTQVLYEPLPAWAREVLGGS